MSSTGYITGPVIDSQILDHFEEKENVGPGSYNIPSTFGKTSFSLYPK
jgi:hypothetical protein